MSKIIFVVAPVQTREMLKELSKELSVLPPLGISILASVARSYGFQTKIIDFLAENETLDNAATRIVEENPKYLGISSTTDMLYSSVELARMVKKRNNNIVILIGGPHISAAPIETMKRFNCFDVGFVGESEETLIHFLRAYENNGNITDIKGLVLKKDNKVIYTGVQPTIKEMDRFPFPAWDLLPDIKKYYKPAFINYKRKPVTSLVSSRGCPGRCIFCNSSILGKGMRAYSSNYVIEMMQHLIREYGIKEICFYDDLFIAFKKRLFEICKNIIERKIDITWSCNARVNLVDLDMLKIMKQAGCWQISYGIESGSQKILDTLKKDISIEQIKDAIEYTKKAGISPKGYFMIGNPNETEEDIKKTRRLMLNSGLDDVLVGYFTPYPGTEAYKEVSKYGTFKSDWKHLNTLSISFVPHALSENYLKQELKSFYLRFYFRPRIIFNYIIRLGSLKKMFFLFWKSIKLAFSK